MSKPSVPLSHPIPPKEEAAHPPVDASAKIEISRDCMSAHITLTAPEYGGKKLNLDDLKALLESNGVVFGIEMGALLRLSHRPSYGMSVAVALGKEPVPGEAARIVYRVNIEKDIRPHERPDGSVDYKDLGIVQLVHKDDILCEKIPPTPGTPGTNVLGAEVPPKPGKDLPMPAGKNTVLSEDKLILYAGMDGQVDLVGNRLQVLNIFNVNSDVGTATGNISFLGNVNIFGSVRTGFSVQATGNITVEGSVDDATVVAGGNIIIKQGINGSSKGILQCGGYLKTKYIQSGTVKATGDIESGSIIHSNVTSGGTVRLIGKGTIVGGRVTARTSINCAVAGSRSSPVPTLLEVGNDPEILARSREIPKEQEITTKNLNALKNTADLLSQLYEAGRLTPEKIEQFESAKKMIEILELKLLQLDQDMEQVQADIVTFGYGNVNVSQIAYPFVRIVIGAESLLLESNHEHCSFVRNEKGIQMVPLRIS